VPLRQLKGHELVEGTPKVSIETLIDKSH
jgi:hypothetical protein